MYLNKKKSENDSDSTSKYFLDSGFHKQIFPGFQIPQAIISWILDSTNKYFLDYFTFKSITMLIKKNCLLDLFDLLFLNKNY